MESALKSHNEIIIRSFKERNIAFSLPDAEGKCLISDLCLESGKVESSLLNLILEEATGVKSIDPTMISYTPGFLEHARKLVPMSVAKQEKVFPIRHEGNYLHLVMALPQDKECIRRMEYVTGSRIKPYCCHSRGILKAIDTFYGEEAEVADFEGADINVLIGRAVAAINMLKLDDADEMEVINDVSVIRLLQFILNSLVSDGTSDIHFEPLEDSFRVRFRKDGMLLTAWTFPSVIRDGIIQRLKLISGMDISKNDLPQDGNISYNLLRTADIDIRSSSLPSIYGEKVVLRILDTRRSMISIAELGFNKDELGKIDKIIKKPGGLILVTGPTGSGKTSTLYAILNELNTEGVNIITAEDPVEYNLKGLTQVSCSSESGLAFSDALRSFLRQDPDIIMVGEIRDRETADIAVKSAMTGHLVLSSLHTNDAAGAVNRLINIGVPPFLVASAQLTVIAQRLVRKICMHCKKEYHPEKETIKILGINEDGFSYYKGEGCVKCSGTGYAGRVGIYELLTLDENMAGMLIDNIPSNVLKAAAIENGMSTLRDSAITKLREGIITPEEVLRVTMDI